MIARRQFYCECGCGENIEPGDEYEIQGILYYKAGHVPADCLETAGVTIKRDYHRMKREIPQKEISNLPLFSRDTPADQLSLF